MWVVGSPDATNWTSREWEDPHKVDTRATDKASHTPKAWSTFKLKEKAEVSDGKTKRQREPRFPAKGGQNVAE